MARAARFSGATKTITATTVQTLIFPANEIEGAGVIAFDVLFQGGADIADVDRIRVKASGAVIIDVTPAQLRAWIEGTARTGTVQLTTDTRLHIPLYMPDLPTKAERDGCQFPTGAQPQVEIDLLATVPAGSAVIGWVKTDEAPRFASRLYGTTMNIAASQNNARHAFGDGGIVRGVVLPTLGIDTARLVLSDREAFNLPGEEYNGFTTVGDGMRILRMDEAPVTITNPFYMPTNLGIQAAQGSSFLELDTEAAWAGVGNEMAIWSVVPLAVADANGG